MTALALLLTLALPPSDPRPAPPVTTSYRTIGPSREGFIFYECNLTNWHGLSWQGWGITPQEACSNAHRHLHDYCLRNPTLR